MPERRCRSSDRCCGWPVSAPRRFTPVPARPGWRAGASHPPAPYIYTAEEGAAVVHAAQTIAAPMPAATCHAVISLIAASGLRVSETLALDHGDVDLDTGMRPGVGKNQQTRL